MRLSKSLILALLCLGTSASWQPAGAAQKNGIFGRWNRDDGLGGINIARCGNALCGSVTWLKDPRGPGHIGQKVFYDMQPASADSWSGKAFNPADGHEYAGTLVLSGSHLTTSGCVLGGLVCKSLGLSRAR